MSICGVKFRSYPTKSQTKIFSQWIGCSRVIYNCKVEEDQTHYLRYKETGEKGLVHQAYSQFKNAERPWLKEVPSQILRNSASIWYQAKQRFFRGLAKNPRKKPKGKRDSVLLTQELFSFKENINEQGGVNYHLEIGTKRYQLGFLKVTYHRDCGIPKQIVISKKNHKWYVSFCYENGIDLPREESILNYFSNLSEQELSKITVGIDRGVVIPYQVSNETQFNFDKLTQNRLEQKNKD